MGAVLLVVGLVVAALYAASQQQGDGSGGGSNGVDPDPSRAGKRPLARAYRCAGYSYAEYKAAVAPRPGVPRAMYNTLGCGPLSAKEREAVGQSWWQGAAESLGLDSVAGAAGAAACTVGLPVSLYYGPCRERFGLGWLDDQAQMLIQAVPSGEWKDLSSQLEGAAPEDVTAQLEQLAAEYGISPPQGM